jgi:ankyrin repeat protein
MKLKNLFILLLIFKFRRFFILLAAAGAGALIHYIRYPDGIPINRDPYAPEQQAEESQQPQSGGGDVYSSVAGKGSLYETLQNAREGAKTGKEYTGRDYGSSIVATKKPSQQQYNNNYGGTNFSGGIGKVGSANSGPYAGSYGNPYAKEQGSSDDLALLQAAAKGDKANVDRRLSAGAKIDSRDSERRTPLMYASANGFEEIIDRLIAAGANPNFKDRAGNNAYDYAAGRGLVETVQYLLDRTRAKDDRHYIEYAQTIRAVYAGDPSILPAGNGKLASVNRINPDGQAPLHIAAGNGSIDLIKVLVKRGAEVNLANKDEQTPLHWAAWNNQPNTAEALLQEGACVFQGEAAGNNALMLAAQSGSKSVAEVLLKYGAEKDIANKDGKTAAMQAEDRGFKDLSNILK